MKRCKITVGPADQQQFWPLATSPAARLHKEEGGHVMLNGGRTDMSPFWHSLMRERFHFWPFFARPKPRGANIDVLAI